MISTTLGVLVPYFNSAVEPELAALRPPDVQHQTARFVLDANVLDDIVGTATKLATCHLDAFLIGLSTESFPGGLELLRQGSKRLTDAAGRPVYTPTFATVEALKVLAAETIAVVTPFGEDANQHVRAALESEGFEVTRIIGLDRPGFDQIADTPHAEIREAFTQADSDAAQALVQVGTGLPVSSLIPELEARFDKPVVSSNQAVYWQALRGLGRKDEPAGSGRLFAL